MQLSELFTIFDILVMVTFVGLTSLMIGAVTLSQVSELLTFLEKAVLIKLVGLASIEACSLSALESSATISAKVSFGSACSLAWKSLY